MLRVRTTARCSSALRVVLRPPHSLIRDVLHALPYPTSYPSAVFILLPLCRVQALNTAGPSAPDAPYFLIPCYVLLSPLFLFILLLLVMGGCSCALVVVLRIPSSSFSLPYLPRVHLRLLLSGYDVLNRFSGDECFARACGVEDDDV
jgi:hypothetical protein